MTYFNNRTLSSFGAGPGVHAVEQPPVEEIIRELQRGVVLLDNRIGQGAYVSSEDKRTMRNISFYIGSIEQGVSDES